MLKDAQRSIDFKIIDTEDIPEGEGGDEADHKEGFQAIHMKVKGLEGTKQVSMNTNALEVKINAVQILKNLARNLDITFYEYVEDVAKVCIEQLIDDPYA